MRTLRPAARRECRRRPTFGNVSTRSRRRAGWTDPAVTRSRAFAHLELTRQFEKSYRRLDLDRQVQCDDALAQLMAEPVASGLHLKPIRPSNRYWEARINRGDRLILFPEGAGAYVMDVVTHDDIRKWGK